ncbi:hypothetical protein GH714_016289 [Hevea brasiliensis]|uniref:PPPDE domain-containing protein n=1 Tax=Hevea brasiliensis TaxID=3981 RepID=A0A6A6MDY0_HEVBR|nr:hypothetical protein GH714_016289 [Hevea brasiliensis]
MGIQTMGSQSNGQQSHLQPCQLTRQNSWYSLTLNEVENQLGNLGKPLGSMNLDELLKNGKEYGFGAHELPVSGVFEVEPRSCPGFIYRCSIPLGRMNMSASEFRTFIETVASEYHGDAYHLISKNCNHFTDDIHTEDGSESLATTTPRDSIEIDDADQEQQLLPPNAVGG